MEQKKSEPKGQVTPKAAAPASGGYRIAGFPKEFERNIWEDLDKRFYIILILSWLFVYGLGITLGLKDYATADLEAKIRDKYLKEFYQVEFAEPVVTEEDITGPGIGEQVEEEPVDERAERDRGRTEEARGRSAREIAESRRAAAAARSQARQQMEQAVAGTGILGVLSAGGGGGSGDAVADVLGEAGGGAGDLGAVLQSVGGLATATSGGQRSRLGSRGGGRSTGSADVNELLSGIGSTGSASIGRKGSISLALGESRVRGKGSKAANRSGDEISRIINSHNDAIEHCYKREVKLNPNLKGDVIVEFTIDYNGRVKDSRIVNSSLRNKKVEDCIRGRIRSWRFKPIDRSEGDVKVQQKYILG